MALADRAAAAPADEPKPDDHARRVDEHRAPEAMAGPPMTASSTSAVPSTTPKRRSRPSWGTAPGATGGVVRSGACACVAVVTARWWCRRRASESRHDVPHERRPPRAARRWPRRRAGAGGSARSRSRARGSPRDRCAPIDRDGSGSLRARHPAVRPDRRRRSTARSRAPPAQRPGHSPRHGGTTTRSAATGTRVLGRRAQLRLPNDIHARRVLRAVGRRIAQRIGVVGLAVGLVDLAVVAAVLPHRLAARERRWRLDREADEQEREEAAADASEQGDRESHGPHASEPPSAEATAPAQASHVYARARSSPARARRRRSSSSSPPGAGQRRAQMRRRPRTRGPCGRLEGVLLPPRRPPSTRRPTVWHASPH